MSSLNLLISMFSYVVLLINILMCSSFLKKTNSFFKWLDLFLILGFIIQICMMFFYLKSSNNLPFVHIYALLEFILLSLFYKEILTKYILFQKNQIYFIIGISILIVLNTIFLQPLNTFNSNIKSLTQIIYIGYAIAYFFQAPFEKNNPLHQFLNLINSAILLYYAGSLFIFMFSSIFPKMSDFHRIFWVANALLYIIFQLLVFAALWTFQRQTKSTYL